MLIYVHCAFLYRLQKGSLLLIRKDKTDPVGAHPDEHRSDGVGWQILLPDTSAFGIKRANRKTPYQGKKNNLNAPAGCLKGTNYLPGSQDNL